MSVFLDIASSLFIRTMMFAVMLNLSYTLHTALYNRSMSVGTQLTLATTSEILYSDLQQAGYNVSGTAFVSIGSKSMEFQGDLDGDGTVEVVRYYGVQNATTGIWSLYRRVNSGTPLLVARNLQDYNFTYYNSKARITSSTTYVKAVRVSLTAAYEGLVEETQGTVGGTTTTREFRIYPINI